MSRSKQKGTAFETLCVNYLKLKGFLGVYRPALTGIGDTGDINGITKRIPATEATPARLKHAIIQCKNHKTFKLGEWMAATKEQAARMDDAVPMLAFKRPGVGKAAFGKTYVLMELDDALDLLNEAGYQ